MYKTKDVLDIILNYLNNNNLKVKSLKGKGDLAFTGLKPKSFLQFIENRYKNNTSLYFESVFNFYVIGKSLGGVEDIGIYNVLDKARILLSNYRFEYLPYIDKSSSLIIENETFTEVQGDTFIYVLRFKIDVKIKK